MMDDLPGLSAEYASRVREYSDAVALLGRYPPGCPEFLKVYKEIQRRRALCREAEEKFDQQLTSKSHVSDKSSQTLGDPKPEAQGTRVAGRC